MKTTSDDSAERARLEGMLKFERELRTAGYTRIAGIDEVGRGPLAGPVVSCAVILPEGLFPIGLDDSKKLSASKRERIYQQLTAGSVCYGVGIVEHAIIDRINILEAAKMSMRLAVSALAVRPDHLLIDAVVLDDIAIPQRSIIKGDTLSQSIAAASVIAKVIRDRIMEETALRYPQYGFEKHKGYGTKDHIQAIRQYGVSPCHRMSFLRNILE